MACHLYAADASGSYVNTAESSTRAFDVPSWVLLCEATHPGAATAREVNDRRPRCSIELGVDVRNDAAVYALEICRLSLPEP